MKEFKIEKGIGLAIRNGNLPEEVFQNALNSVFKELSDMSTDSDNLNYVGLQADDHMIITSCKNDFTIVALNRIKKALEFIKEGYLIIESNVSHLALYKYKMEFFDDKITLKFIEVAELSELMKRVSKGEEYAKFKEKILEEFK